METQGTELGHANIPFRHHPFWVYIFDWNNPFVVMAMKLLRFERFTYICPLSEIYIEIMIARPPRTPWSWSPEDHLKVMQICHLDPSGVQFPYPDFLVWWMPQNLLVNSTNTAKNERLSNPYLVSHFRCGDIPVLVGHPHVRSVKSIVFPSGILNSNQKAKDRKHGTVTVSSFVVP